MSEQLDPFEQLRGVREFATPAQQAAITAYMTHGTVREAAIACNVSAPRLRAHLSEARKRAAKRGWSPDHGMIHTVPAGFSVKGVSQYQKATESSPAQWVKFEAERAKTVDALREAALDAFDPVRGIVKPTPLPPLSGDKLGVMTWGDPHVGLRALAQSTRDADFGLDDVLPMMLALVKDLIRRGKAAGVREVVLASLGDLAHANDSTNRTPRSGHQLAVGWELTEIIRTVARLLRQSIGMLLGAFESVHVVLVEGNHDPDFTRHMRVLLEVAYENEPRVTLDDHDGYFHYIEHGQNLIGLTHGHTCKPPAVPGIMAVDAREAWGRTSHHYGYTGHIHSRNVWEEPGCLVESCRTATPADRHASGGWRSMRDMMMHVHDPRGGRPAQLCADPTVLGLGAAA